MAINRSLSDDRFERILRDFEFLFERVRQEHGELDLRLRDNYFNVYHRGNSLAKVELGPREGPYRISISREFAEGELSDTRFPEPSGKGTLVWRIPPMLLHAFFQTKHIDRLKRRIAERNYGEEITFEQMLITDNMNREDFYIIDRQVIRPRADGKRVDALAIQQVEPGINKYRFVVLEAKLGCNPELEYEVGPQLQSYLDDIDQHFDEFKACYERTYCQMQKTGLFRQPAFDRIEIVRPVEGWIVVGGYSGMAGPALAKLYKAWPNMKGRVREMFHRW